MTSHDPHVTPTCPQVEELVRLSLNRPVRLFVDSNNDVAGNLRQEFVRVKEKKERDREAIITGEGGEGGRGEGGGGSGGRREGEGGSGGRREGEGVSGRRREGEGERKGESGGRREGGT